MRMFPFLKFLFWSEAPSALPGTYMLISNDKACVTRDFPGFLCDSFPPPLQMRQQNPLQL